ncbi:MAG: aspartate--tRNA ligase [Enterobacteriaceae bacterium]
MKYLLSKKNIGKKVKVNGWVNKFRVFGKIAFMDIRSKNEIIQIKINTKKNKKILKKIKNEFCLEVNGIIKKRPKDKINKNIKTGKIEVIAKNLKIINKSLPLPIDIYSDLKNDNYLKFRYLELRNVNLKKNLILRSNVVKIIRNFLDRKNFLEVETPILSKSSSEGAKDYLVISKTKKKFYALPQSPQIFKQLLMISGIEKYYQLAKCFRNEDLRSDRQPEFTQIDIESSFVNISYIMKLSEKLIYKIWLKTLNFKLPKFKKIKYKDSIKKFGSDKPDLRIPFNLINIKLKEEEILQKLLFKKFDYKLKSKILKINDKNKVILKKLNKYYKKIKKYKVNLIYIIYSNKKYAKICYLKNKNFIFVEFRILEKILQKKIEIDEIIIIVTGKTKSSIKSIGFIRNLIGKDLNLINYNDWKPVWIVGYPMFKKDKNNKISPMHHIFTEPKNLNIKKFIKNPISYKSTACDLVINGVEIGSGSSRIKNHKLQKKIFDIIKINKSMRNKQFGYFIKALKYGTPPHAGIGLGLDRILMLLTNSKSIKNVIAFPKDNKSNDKMMSTPDYKF